MKSKKSESTDPRRALELTVEFEAMAPIEDIRISGWVVWPAIRPYFVTYFKKDVGCLPFDLGRKLLERINPENFKALFYYLPYSFFHLLKRFLFLPEPEYVFFVNSSYRSDTVAGREKSVFFDDVIERLEKKRIFHIEELGVGYRYSRNPYSRPEIYDKLLLFFQKFVVMSRKEKIELENASAAIERLLRSHFRSHSEKPPENFYPVISIILRKFIETRKLFKFFYSLLKPDFVFLICAFDKCGHVAGAREAGVKVVEMQHGIIYPYHYGYIWPGKLSPFRDCVPAPDYILAHDLDTRRLLVAPLEEDFSGSGPMAERILKPEPFWRKEQVLLTGCIRHDYFLKNMKPAVRQRTGRLEILITSQPLVQIELVEFLKDVLAILEQKAIDYFLRIKLHPVEVRDSHIALWKEFEQQHRDRVEVYPGDTRNLFRMMIDSDIHASVASTSHFDSVRLGVPTFVLDILDYDIDFLRFNKYGFITIKNPEDFAGWLVSASAEDERWKAYRAHISSLRSRLTPENAIERTLTAINLLSSRLKKAALN